MTTGMDKNSAPLRIELDAKERDLIVRSLRALWEFHINAQMGVVARFSGGDASLRQALEASDEQLAKIRSLAARLNAGVVN
ncbi:hypothetical protein FCE95_13705 [Luteimonas gilva]|uniref:Uncharacterized protein n=1 Tax=Luteimonas gilva TaxID=2572684 RepID=A0A4U5JKN9_9GAMM|nr:hypothetical protein [Luteimonas gilva]TKR29216.1 hypothetical protein FCE95_13705 [Luteimonas gilva]